VSKNPKIANVIHHYQNPLESNIFPVIILQNVYLAYILFVSNENEQDGGSIAIFQLTPCISKLRSKMCRRKLLYRKWPVATGSAQPYIHCWHIQNTSRCCDLYIAGSHISLPTSWSLSHEKWWSYPCSRSWRPVGLWDIRAVTFLDHWLMEVRLSALHSNQPATPFPARWSHQKLSPRTSGFYHNALMNTTVAYSRSLSLSIAKDVFLVMDIRQWCFMSCLSQFCQNLITSWWFMLLNFAIALSSSK
jgi:hypothetical protein